MDKRYFVRAVLLSFFCCGIVLSAQENNRKPPSVIQHAITVSATRLETDILEVANSVTILTAEELARTQKTSVLEAIRDITGLTILQNGGPGSSASVLIRGANSEHTLFLLDGFELNDPINPARSYDLAHLPVSQVERVEIIRGPQSPLYGSDALGGLVHVITREGRGKPAITLSTTAGSFNSLSGDCGFSGAAGKASYAIGLAFRRTDGISAASSDYAGNAESDGYRNITLSGKFGYSLREKTSLSLVFRSHHAKTDIDSFGGPFGDDPNSTQKYGSWLIQGRVRNLAFGNRWEQIIAFSLIRSRRDHDNPEDTLHPQEREEGFFRSGLLKLDWQNNFFLHGANTLTTGVEIEREMGRSHYLYESAFGTTEVPFPSVEARSAGIYLQDRWELGKGLFLIGGFRVDRHSRAGSALTVRFAPAYVISTTETKLKATIGTGFKSPSLYQLFAPGTSWGPIGNPELTPERSTAWDAGIEQALFGGRLSVGLTYFKNIFRALIDFDYQEGYVNIGEAETSGAEATMDFLPVKNLRFRAAYTRLTTRNRETGAVLFRRPRDKFSADLHSQVFGRFDVTLSLLYAGKRIDRDFSVFPYETVSLPEYVLLDGVITAKLGPSWEVFVRLENIFDAKYETVWGYGQPGFALNTGLRLTL